MLPAFGEILRRGHRRACFPRLPDAGPAPLADEIASTLTALVQIVVEGPDAPDRLTQVPIDWARYEVLFRRRAATVRGWLPVARALADDLDARARRRHGTPFAACDPAARRAIAAAVFRGVGVVRWGRVFASVLRRRALRYQDHVIAPALLLFSRTDAMLRLGYSAWPGQPADLDAYQRPHRLHG